MLLADWITTTQGFVNTLTYVYLALILLYILMTGAGMMQCKQALQETGGDLEAARTLLREKGMLDRVDSILWAGPAAFYLVLALT